MSSLNPQIMSGAAVVVFLVVQLFAAVMFLVVRYHFNRFASARDLRARAIVGLMCLGLVVIAVAGALVLFATFGEYV